MNLFAKKKQTHRQKTNYGYRGEEHGRSKLGVLV